MKSINRNFPLFGIVRNNKPLVIEQHGSILLFEDEETLIDFCRASSKRFPNCVIVEMQGQPALVRHLRAAQKCGGKLVTWNAVSLDSNSLEVDQITHLLGQLTGPEAVTSSRERLQFPAQLLIEDDAETPRMFEGSKGQAIAIFDSEAAMVFVVQALGLGDVVRAKIASAANLVCYLDNWARNNPRAEWILMQPFLKEDGELDFADEQPLAQFMARLKKQATASN